jgi:hypothetical protein
LVDTDGKEVGKDSLKVDNRSLSTIDDLRAKVHKAYPELKGIGVGRLKVI